MSLLARLPLAADSVASEGKHIIIGMLITALIFVAVILLGQTFRWLGHRRHARRAARRSY
jgi:hypothetical protein